MLATKFEYPNGINRAAPINRASPKWYSYIMIACVFLAVTQSKPNRERNPGQQLAYDTVPATAGV